MPPLGFHCRNRVDGDDHLPAKLNSKDWIALDPTDDSSIFVVPNLVNMAGLEPRDSMARNCSFTVGPRTKGFRKCYCDATPVSPSRTQDDWQARQYWQHAVRYPIVIPTGRMLKLLDLESIVLGLTNWP